MHLLDVNGNGNAAATTLTLSRSRIDLWLAYCDAPDEALLTRYRQLLSPDEKDRESRFYFARDRRRFVVTRALLRTALSRYAPTAPVDWRFGTNAYGRPHVMNDGELEQALCFNLSHTSEVVLLAVGVAGALGVDVEMLRHEVVAEGVAERFFAPVEVAALAGLAAKARPDRFFEYWTLKEAYIKARGMGLSIPLDSFAFDLSRPGRIGFSVAAGTDDVGDWRFWQFKPTARHWAAVCAADCGDAPALSLRTAVPLVGDTPGACALSRRSGEDDE